MSILARKKHFFIFLAILGAVIAMFAFAALRIFDEVGRRSSTANVKLDTTFRAIK